MQRVQNRLIWWFIFWCLLPMLLVSFIAYKRFEESYRQEALTQLEALATTRADQLDDWVTDQTDHIKVMASNPEIADCTASLAKRFAEHGTTSLAYQQEITRCRPYLRVERLNSLEDLLLISTTGRIVYSMQRNKDFGANLFAKPLAASNLAAMARVLQRRPDLYFVPYEYYAPAGEPSAFWIAPLKQAGKLTGFLAIRLNQHVFDRIAQSAHGLGTTGENLILSTEPDGSALVMAPLRHVNNAAHHMRISPEQQAGQPMWQALAGAHGTGQGIDYRGEPVLAAWAPARRLGWAVVVKRDEADALAPVIQHRNSLIVLLLAISLACSVLALWRGRKLVYPIRQLVDASQRIARGEWQTRLPALGKTEFGLLGRTFNTMIEQIELSQQQRQLQLEDAEYLARLGYCITYSNGQPDEWSDQLYQILGLPREQPADMKLFLARIHPSDLQRVLIAQATGPQHSYEVSYRLLLPDGQLKYLHEVGRHEFDSQGEPLRRVASIQDISAAERMEQQVHEAQQALEQERLAHAELAASNAEAKAQAILQTMGEGVLGLTRDGRVVFCNRAAAMMLGSEADLLGGQLLDDFLYQYNAFGLRLASPSPLLRAVQQNQPCSSHQEQFASISRERFPVFYQLNMLSRPIGELYAVLLFRDISLQRANEMRLEQMSRAVTQSPAGVMITDPQGIIEYANPRLLQMTGYQEHELLGQFSNKMRSGHTPDSVYADLWSTLHAGNSWHGELLNRRKDGSKYWVMQLISPLRDGNGRLTHYISVQEDITTQKQMATRLQEAVAEAESATAAKSSFLANMSHEIRTPMNAIIGMADLAMHDDLPPRARNFIGKVVRSARSLLGILNDILDFSKIESGHLQIESAPFALEDVLAPLADMLAMRLDNRPVELLFDVAVDVPEHWQGDALRLGQILLNLLSNAIKFTTRGSVVLQVRWDGQQLHFAVRDTGIGMTEEQQRRLFIPFSQADVSTQRQYGGTGLGLVISAQLVQMMGGSHIQVHSAPEQGSTLSFSLPLTALAKRNTAGWPAAGRLFHLGLASACGAWVQQQCRQHGIHGQALLDRQQLQQVLAQWQQDDVLLLDGDNLGWLPLVSGLHWPEKAHIVLLGRHQPAGEEPLPAALQDIPIHDTWLKPLTAGRLGQSLQALTATTMATPQPGTIHRSRLDGCQILVVDDVPMNQEVVAAYLQEAGAQVSFAANGQEALQLLEQCLPDAVLMDCHMPVMDGFAATRAIRANPAWHHLKIIALTANALSGTREEVLAAGMDDYISKPIEPQLLFAALQQAGLQPRIAGNHPRAAGQEALVETETPATPTDGWDRLRQAGVNVEDGLARAMNQPEIYRKWLQMFAHSMANFGQQVAAAVAAGDKPGLHHQLHRLKGVAANVSAEQIVADVVILEDIIEREGGIAEAREKIEKLQQALQAVFDAAAQVA